MTTQKDSSDLTKTLKINSTGNRRKRLITIAVLLPFIIIAYFVWLRPTSSVPAPVEQTLTKPEHVQTVTPTAAIAKVDSIENSDNPFI